MGVSSRRMMPKAVAGLVLLALVPFLGVVVAEKRDSQIRDDSRPMIMFERFGFDSTGMIEFNISGVEVKLEGATAEEAANVGMQDLGFILTTEEELVAVAAFFREADEEQKSVCVLQNNRVNTLFTLKEVQEPYFARTLSPSGANEYTLFFVNCVRNSVVTMDVKTSMYNMEGSTRDYLPAGQTQLPLLFFTCFLVYVVLGFVWSYICTKQRDTVHRIHILMGILILLKALNLLAEAEEKYKIKMTGKPHGWDIAFYILGFLRAVMLFTVIVLIGTGWSFLKPYLQEKEKKVLLIVIPLQVFANVAVIITGETGPSTKDWFTWKQVFYLLDIICCCAVLFPIVWSIKHLREASHTDGKAARNVKKLTLFRQYYIVVVSYIYFTRIVVFALTTVTDYRYRWTTDLAQELASLAFYIFTGYKFRPVVHNPYFVLDEEEEEAPVADPLKDDEFDL
ncbi:unnamed protein product [Calypogeia fissa]